MTAPVLDGIDLARWRVVERVLDEALDLDPCDVPAHLARACAGDAALRREVESLLESDRGAHDFLLVPAIDRMPWLVVPGGTDPDGTDAAGQLRAPAAPEAPTIGRSIHGDAFLD